VVLSQERWQLVTPSTWVAQLPLSALAAHPWVMGLDAGVGQHALASVCASAGFSPRVSTTTANRDVLFGLVSAEQGVGVVPAVPWRATPEVCLSPFAEEAATRRTVAIHVRGRSDLTLDAALRTLREVTVAA
jgi:DNA-binding transcriptional LysR family regulator